MSSSWRIPPLTNQFLRLFLPAALVLGLIVVAGRYHSDAIERESALSSQAYGIALAAEGVNRDLETASADLQALAASRTLRSFAGQASEQTRQPVADEFAAFIRHKQLYTDVTYIDPDSGRQLAVSRTDDGEIRVRPSSSSSVDPQLLDTAGALDSSGIVLSRLNLSTEQGMARALVHFATAVRDLDEQTRGALILTYTSPRLMAHLDETLAQRPGTDILVNRRGQWLRRDDPEGAWTMPDGGRFQEVYPQAWKTMTTADMGQFQNRNGLFTFTTIYPRTATELRTVAATDTAGDGVADGLPSWKIVSLVDASTLAAAAAARFWRTMLIYLVLIVPTAIGAYYIARFTQKRRDNRQRLRELGAVVEQSHDMVLITDAQGHVRYVNPRFETITGYQRDEVVGRTPGILKSGTHGKAFYRRMWSTIQRGEAFQAMVTNRKKNGELFHVQITISPLNEKDVIVGYVATGKDITSQVHTQERLLKLAFHHPLTGLPNRALFRDHLHEAAARARRGGHSVAVLFIDLDRFKKVNDSLGHQAGDTLLKEVAERLRHAVREMDMVAHLGGDEFTVLLDGIQHPTQIQAVAAKLLQLFDDPFTVAERELYVGASIGIAVFPTDSDTVEKLMEQADTAMYQAKRAGRSQYQFYSADMTMLANERLELENRLRTALSENQFELHFQPIVDPIRRELRGLEALIRWRQPDGELIGPNQFIPVLEETGLVVPVTEWVLAEACRECRRLNDAGMSRVRMNVNISARSFHQGDLVETVRRALRRSRLPATQLVLEVTESLLLEDQRHVQKSLEQLRALGVGIAIDDFGTGYSSLAYLKRLPVNIIKIDRAFIHGVGPDSRDAALVSAMMAMAQELQMDVVAEGVEEPHQLEFLRQRGCDGAQGYLFSIPLPADNIAAWLDRDARWPWKPWMDPTEAKRLH